MTKPESKFRPNSYVVASKTSEVLLKDCYYSSENSTQSFDTDLYDQETDGESIYSAEGTEGEQSYDDQHIVSNIN